MSWEIKPTSGLTPDGNPSLNTNLVPIKPKKISREKISVVHAEIIDSDDRPVTQGQLASLLSRFLSPKSTQPLIGRTNTIIIGGEPFDIDPEALMRMVKQITQQIGEYKSMNNTYTRYVVPALRKARSDMISDLEHHFHIKWRLDSNGQSVFSP